MSGSEPCLEDIYPAPPPPPNGQGIVVFTVGHRTLGLKPLVDNLECVGGVCGSVCGLSVLTIMSISSVFTPGVHVKL